MNRIILFDIDQTLIDTDKFRNAFTKTITAALKTSQAKHKSVANKYISNLNHSRDFNPDDYLDHLSRAFQINASKLRKLSFDQAHFYQKSLFPEVNSVLRDLSQKNTLGIYSEGFVEFQIRKLNKAKIIKYFDKSHFYIFRNKLEPSVLKTIPKNAVIVDNNINILKVLMKRNYLRLIWINRKDKRRHQKIKTIHKLSELLL